MKDWSNSKYKRNLKHQRGDGLKCIGPQNNEEKADPTMGRGKMGHTMNMGIRIKIRLHRTKEVEEVEDKFVIVKESPSLDIFAMDQFQAKIRAQMWL